MGIDLATSPKGRILIAQREGTILHSYQDSIGVWTCCVGHTSAAGAPDVKKGMTFTVSQCDDILSRDLKKFETTVNAAVARPLADHEFDALVSLCFNIGGHAFTNSTLVKKLNTGDRRAAADHFLDWNKAGGKTVDGLTNRRRAERQQFLTPYA